MLLDRRDQCAAILGAGELRHGEQIRLAPAERAGPGILEEPPPHCLADRGEAGRIGLFVGRPAKPEAGQQAQAASFLSTYCRMPPLR